MRFSTLPMILVVLACSACAGPRPSAEHWGEAQRVASEEMIGAAHRDEGRGIDGAGAGAAYDNYVESLEPVPDAPPKVLLDIVEPD
jgi:hypothetical protein